MNRIKILGLLPVLCLTACGGQSLYGDYSFGLGKTDGSHFGVSVSLSKEAYKGKEGMKKIKFSAEFGDDFSIKDMVDSYKEKYPIIDIFFSLFVNESVNVSEVNGYYYISDIKTEFGKRLYFGTEDLTKLFSDDLKNLINAYDPDLLSGDTFDVKPEMVEKVVTAYINTNKKELTFKIPVSMSDVQQQLLWYGYFVDTGNPGSTYQKLDLDKFPGKKGEDRYGSHPKVVKNRKGEVVEDQIKMVNETFKYEFSHTALYSKDDASILGRFYQEINEANEKVLYFLPANDEINLSHLNGKVYTMDILGAFDEKREIKFSVDAETHATNVTYNHEAGTKEGFTDEDGREFTFNYFMQTPFVFRDFHDVDIGLKK